jgi:hypothetical protein
LAYAETDKDKAKRVIQSMVSIFVESSLGASRKDTDSAKVFIDEQIKTYESSWRPRKPGSRSFAFATSTCRSVTDAILLPFGRGVQALEGAKLQLREAEQSRDAAKRQLDWSGPELRLTGVVQSLLQESSINVRRRRRSMPGWRRRSAILTA